MTILRIQHPVPDFNDWKAAFDRDPVAREQSGVRRYRIMRPIDDPNFALVDLEFDGPEEAKAMLGELRELWRRVQGTIIEEPQARIVEVVETRVF